MTGPSKGVVSTRGCVGRKTAPRMGQPPAPGPPDRTGPARGLSVRPAVNHPWGDRPSMGRPFLGRFAEGTETAPVPGGRWRLRVRKEHELGVRLEHDPDGDGP